MQNPDLNWADFNGLTLLQVAGACESSTVKFT